MKKLTILIIMLLAFAKANAQQISGKVVNEQDMPMEYVSCTSSALVLLIHIGYTSEFLT